MRSAKGKLSVPEILKFKVPAPFAFIKQILKKKEEN
jgi:hypothetical protein